MAAIVMVATHGLVSDPHRDDESSKHYLVGMIQRDNFGSSTASREPTSGCTSSQLSTRNMAVGFLVGQSVVPPVS